MTERAVELVNEIAQGIKNYIEEKEKPEFNLEVQ